MDYNDFMKFAIKIENLKKYYGKLKAVDGIDLEIKQGEIFGFLGPNGAGKSTTIRCLMGFNKATSGEIYILGKNIKDHEETIKSQVGYLPGNVKLYDNLTGWDHIKFFESVRGKSDNVEDLIKRFDFDPNIRFRNLSSGNKQKLGLILALMNNPKLIIMDEPTVGLDPLLQFEIHKVLKELRANGSTVFISSHNLNEVEILCDRVAIIKKGKIVSVETIKDIGSKKIYKIEVQFKDEVDEIDFSKVDIDSIERAGNNLTITVSGNVKPILAIILKHEIVDLEITKASLEDVFMKFYERMK